MRRICLLVASAMLAGLLAGCAGGTDGGVEITVVTPFGPEDGNRANFVAVCEAYEAETGNTVNDRSGTSNEEWKAQILSDFETGNEPDIVFFFTGADADGLVKSNKVVPIADIRREYADYASNMKDSMMPVSTVDGRQYAVPVNGYWEGLYVNKAVLADCGVAVPGADYTWEQFLRDCQVIKDKGYTPVACSLNEVPHYWFEFCVFNNGSISTHTTLPQSADDKAGKAWTAGLEDIKTLYESGFFPENTTEITDTESNFLMTGDKAAFMIDGSWKIGWFQSNAANIDNFAVTYVPAKGERRPTDIIGGLSMGYYITKKAWDDPDKRDACVKFVMDMTTDDVVSAFGAMVVTALRNGTTQPENADPLVVSALGMTKGCTGITPVVQDGLNPTARTALFDDVKNIVTGAITPGEAIDSCLSIGE